MNPFEMMFFAIASVVGTAITQWAAERMNPTKTAPQVEAPRDPYLEAAEAEVEELLA